jgi:sec-independent protein translocase protein TatB
VGGARPGNSHGFLQAVLVDFNSAGDAVFLPPRRQQDYFLYEVCMFGIGLPEMILILALALIVVGPDKLPELARSVAKGVLELKKTVSALKEDLAEDNPFDSVRPELEEAADSIKKQLGEATPDGFTGVVRDLESELQEVIDTDATVIPVEQGETPEPEGAGTGPAAAEPVPLEEEDPEQEAAAAADKTDQPEQLADSQAGPKDSPAQASS